MKKFAIIFLRKMSELIKSFWLLEAPAGQSAKTYPDFPMTPFGPTRLISKETLQDLLK